MKIFKVWEDPANPLMLKLGFYTQVWCSYFCIALV